MDIDARPTRDQALLALVVKEAHDVTRSGSGYLGRTAMQKILYFLQVCDVPMRYRFSVYHYGPFCASILGDIDWLMFTGDLEDISNTPEKYSNYRLTDEGEELIERFEKEWSPHRGVIRTIVPTLVKVEPIQLELISTMHYAYRELDASKKGTPTQEKVFSRFKEFKKDKFACEELKKAYDLLSECELINTPNE